MLALMLVVAVPTEVTAFVERYRQCIRWVGEDPYDPAHAREIQATVAALRCDRLERDEALLRVRFRDRPDLIGRLDALRRLD